MTEYDFKNKFALLDTNILSRLAKEKQAQKFRSVFDFLRENRVEIFLTDATYFEFVGFTPNKKDRDTLKAVRTKGEECIPCDYRIYQSEEKKVKTKNQYFREMLAIAKKRGFKPFYVLADCWYGSVENMKYIERQEWKFIMGAKENRQVSITKNIYVSISNARLWQDTGPEGVAQRIRVCYGGEDSRQKRRCSIRRNERSFFD